MSFFVGKATSYLFSGDYNIDALYVGAEKVFPPAPWWLHGKFYPNRGTTYSSVFSRDGKKLFRTEDQDVVVVSDVETRKEITRVSLGAGCRASGLLLSPDGSKIYVTDQITPFKVRVMDTTTYALTDLCSLPGYSLAMISHPDGKTIYAPDINFSLYKIDATTGAFTTTAIPFGTQRATRLAITSDGSKLFLSGSANKKVTFFDTATNSVITTLTLTGSADGISLSKDEKFLYVGDSTTVAPNQGVSVISVASNTVVGRIPTKLPNYSVRVSPDGRYLYCAQVMPGQTASLEVINLQTEVSEIVVPLGSGYMFDMTLSPDGRNIVGDKSMWIARANYPNIGVPL